MAPFQVFVYDGPKSIVIQKWKIQKGFAVNQSPFVLFTYRTAAPNAAESPADGNNGDKNVTTAIVQQQQEEQKFKITKSGIIVKRLTKNNGDRVEPNEPLFEYESCQHPTLMKDLCAVCGVNINKLDSVEQRKITENANVSMIHSIPELRVSKKIAEDLGRADEERLLRNRKLVLLVDLDQTIVHSTNQPIPRDLSDEIFHYQLYGPHSPWYHTKFRPYMMEFLEEISQYYELHICTFGARRYAHHIAHLIDPKCKYFPKDRILSRDEFFDPRSKTGNMKSLFPCGDAMVCIIDDRIDVWNYVPNVVQVKPYLCFKTDDINAPEKLIVGLGDEEKFGKDEPGEKTESSSAVAVAVADEAKSDKKNNNDVDDSKKSEDTDKDAAEKSDTLDVEMEKNDGEDDERKALLRKEFEDILDDKDDYLLYLKEILKKIHRKYYEEYDEKIKYRCEGEEILIPDLKQIIPAVRRTVLHSVNIVFSGVIATNISPSLNRYYRLAETMGARITNDIIVNGSPKTTHLIAAKWGTVKVNRCLKYKHIKIVTPGWLLNCGERWERVDEALFQLTKDTVYNVNEKEDYRRARHHHHHQQQQQDQQQQPSTSKQSSATMLDMMPLSNFTANDLNDMDKEVADACSESGSSSSDDDDSDSNDGGKSAKRRRPEPVEYEDDDDESISYAYEGEYPRGWKAAATTELAAAARADSSGLEKRGQKRSNGIFDEENEDNDDDDDEDERQQMVDKLSETSSSSTSADSIGSVDEAMAAALEKEFFNS